MTNPLTIFQSEYTVDSSFDRIEMAFSMARNAMPQQPALKDELDAACAHLADVWKQKLHQEHAPFASVALFEHLFQSALQIRHIHLVLQGKCRARTLDMPKIRGVLCALVRDVYDLATYDPLDH